MAGNRILTFFLLSIVSVAVGYMIIKGMAYPAFLSAIGILLFALIMQSDHRLPVLLMYVSLLAADSHFDILRSYGLKLRWAILGVLVLKEVTDWAFSKQIKVRVTAAHVFFLFFLIYAMVSSLYSVNSTLTFSRGASVLLFYIVVFLYFWQHSFDSKSRIKLISFVALCSPLIYFAEVAFMFLYPGSSWSGGRLRCISGNPNGLGQIIMITMPMIYWYLVSEQKPRYKFYLIFGIIVGLVLLTMSASRGSLVSLSICILIITLKIVPKYFIGTLLFSVFFAFAVIIYGLNKPVEEINKAKVAQRFEEGGLAGRQEAWEKAFNVGLEKPFLGHGFGTAMITFGTLEFKEHYGAYPHNFVLHTFVDLGLVGVVLVFLLHLVLLFYAVKVISNRFKGVDSGIPFLAVGIYLAGLFNAFFESWMFSAGSPSAFPFWLLTMLMIRYATDKTSRYYSYGKENISKTDLDYLDMHRYPYY